MMKPYGIPAETDAGLWHHRVTATEKGLQRFPQEGKKSYEAEAELMTKKEKPRSHVRKANRDEEALANAGRRC